MKKDCISDPPTEPGLYCVSVHGVRTFMPVFWRFDGTDWITSNTLVQKPLVAGVAVWYDKNAAD